MGVICNNAFDAVYKILEDNSGKSGRETYNYTGQDEEMTGR